MEIEIEKYLSESEIKEIVKEQLRYEITKMFQSEKNATRILSNLSYEIVYNEIDKVVPESRELIITNTKKVLQDIKSYSVFRDSSYDGKSLATKYLESAVNQNKDLIDQKVKDTIINKDYSKEIWTKFESLAETFISNIYSIVELGKQKSNTNT